MRKLDYFGAQDNNLPTRFARTLQDKASPELMGYLNPMIKDLSGWEERDRIIVSNAIAPVITLLEQGWDSNDILQLEEWQLRLAANSKLPLKVFLQQCSNLGITAKTDEYDATAMLTGGYTREEEALVRNIRNWDKYRKFIPKWVREKGVLREFSQAITTKTSSRYYLEAISRIDTDSFFAVKRYSGNILVNLCLLPLYEDLRCNTVNSVNYSRLQWIYIVSKGHSVSYPLYLWEDVQNIFTRYEGKAEAVIKGHTLVVVFDYVIKSFYLPPFLDYQESEDPVLYVIRTASKHYKLDLSIFQKETLYSKVFFAILEVINGNYDWLLYLHYPNLFDVFNFYERGSLAQTIRIAMRIRKAEALPGVEEAWVLKQNGPRPLYIEFLQQGRNNEEGEVLKYGTKKTSEATIIKCLSALRNGMRKN